MHISLGASALTVAVAVFVAVFLASAAMSLLVSYASLALFSAAAS
jgi:hypothetical protein